MHGEGARIGTVTFYGRVFLLVIQINVQIKVVKWIQVKNIPLLIYYSIKKLSVRVKEIRFFCNEVNLKGGSKWPHICKI